MGHEFLSACVRSLVDSVLFWLCSTTWTRNIKPVNFGAEHSSPRREAWLLRKWFVYWGTQIWEYWSVRHRFLPSASVGLNEAGLKSRPRRAQRFLHLLFSSDPSGISWNQTWPLVCCLLLLKASASHTVKTRGSKPFVTDCQHRTNFPIKWHNMIK